MFTRLNRFIRPFTSHVKNMQPIPIKVIENGWFLNTVGSFTAFLMLITLGSMIDNIFTNKGMHVMVRQRNFEIENEVFQKEREKRMSEVSGTKNEK